MKKKIIILLVATLLVISGIVVIATENKGDGNYIYPSQRLLKAIDEGASIMVIQPHPDDSECFVGGIFTISKDRGNKCWIVCLGSLENVPEPVRELRREDVEWFENNYLEEYIFLEFLVPWTDETYIEMEQPLIDVIEENEPDILLTFTPYGFNNKRHHKETFKLVRRISSRLSYEPKICMFLNMDEGFVQYNYYEYDKFPFTDVLHLNRYSEVLNMTYWAAKVDIWQHYRDSVRVLNRAILDGLIENHSRKEYFRCKLL